MSVTPLSAAPSAPAGLPNATYGKGRRCTHVGADGERCITRLCHMNPGPDCFAHSGRKVVERDPQIPRELQAA